MTSRSLLSLVFLSFAACVLPARAADLTLRIDQVATADGQVMVALFDRADNFLKRPVRVANAAATAGSITLVIKDLAPGDYGVAVYHDANGNGKMDTNPMGIPLEPIAFGNDVQGHMGPPAFDAARLAVPAAGLAASVSLR